MSPTTHQQALQAHVAAFAKRHGYEADPVTVADLGDETFGLLETRSAVYLFSLPHDSPHVDVMSLYGESATLALLALTRLGAKSGPVLPVTEGQFRDAMGWS